MRKTLESNKKVLKTIYFAHKSRITEWTSVTFLYEKKFNLEGPDG